MENFEEWLGYWRSNPHRFITDYLGLRLYDFQKVLIYMMFKYPSFVYVASRGLAKSTLALIFAVAYCILYPGTTIVVVAPTRGQSTRFVKKIQDLSRGRLNLSQEIKDVKTGLNESRIDFCNGSAIITLPYSENSLGEENLSYYMIKSKNEENIMKEYTFEEINYIKNNYYIMSAKEIADYLNRPVSSVQDKISKLGLSKVGAKNSAWTDEQINILKTNYQTLSYSQLCNLIGKTEKAIKVKAHKLGIKKKPTYFNPDAFNKIMSEDDAYWLGFMFADGYVVKRDKFSYFGIELRKSDMSHLRKFNIYLNGNLEIYTRHRESQIEGRAVSYDTATILVTSDELVDNLIHHGCAPRKSFVIDKPVDIADDLIIPFIRGYFDGNGSFGVYNNGQYDVVKFNISCASIKFLEWIKEYLLCYNIKTNIVKDKNVYKLSASSKSAKVFIDMIYNNSSTYLDRKYEKYIKMRPMLQ